MMIKKSFFHWPPKCFSLIHFIFKHEKFENFIYILKIGSAYLAGTVEYIECISA